MRILVAWGSKRGGTGEIGEIVAERLREHDYDVTAKAVDEVDDLEGVEAVVIGGALYANRWPAPLRRFLERHTDALRRRPVWFFSSGPLDDSADRDEIPPPPEVEVFAERVGAKGHVTFGGRLAPDAKGMPASAMARDHAGDWRNPERIRDWADALAAELPEARPGTSIDHPGHSLLRLLAYGFAGWAASATVMAFTMAVASTGTATLVRALVVPVLFGLLAWDYFRALGPREPRTAAIVWASISAVFDAAVMGGLVLEDLRLLAGDVGTWIALASIFLVTWAVGSIIVMSPSSFLEEDSAGPAP